MRRLQMEDIRSVSSIDVNKSRAKLEGAFPGCYVKLAAHQREVIAEISDGIAVAVIKRSQPHFHLTMIEVFRVLRGTLFYVACGGGRPCPSRRRIDHDPARPNPPARCAGEPAWIEVESSPPWSSDDHFVQ